MSTSCPICEKRRGKRFCPGLGRSRWAGGTETICARCCGEQREVTIDCPADCPYLIAAHRYESEHPSALRASGQVRQPPAQVAFPDVEIGRDFLDEQQPLLLGLGITLVKLARDPNAVRDADVLAALDALARSYQTLAAGLYYEQTPDTPAAQAAANVLKTYLEQHERELRERTGSGLRPGDILRALVFLRRLGQLQGNGRPLSRRYLDFLRAHLPPDALGPAPETGGPRIIIPGR